MNSLTEAMVAGAKGEDLFHSLEVGAMFKYGTDAAVIARVNGKKCLKIMAHLPADLQPSEAGFRGLFQAWVNNMNVPLSQNRAIAVLFAAELTG